MSDENINYASTLGLDENIFVVRAVKGSSTYSNVVGLNTGSGGYIRIGNQVEFIIEVKQVEGYTITINSVTLSNTGLNNAVLGTFTVNDEAGEMKKYDINGSKVTIKVTDTTKNRDLKSIVIQYSVTANQAN